MQAWERCAGTHTPQASSVFASVSPIVCVIISSTISSHASHPIKGSTSRAFYFTSHFTSPTSLVHSLSGAVLGYGLLWLVGWGFEQLAGKEGLGQGDLKLLAGIGAWVGVWSLLPLLLLASTSGLIFGVIQKMRGQLGHNGHFAFGPFLAFSGFACFFLGISMGA